MMLLHSLILIVIIYRGGQKSQRRTAPSKTEPPSTFSFNSDFFWLGYGCIPFHTPLWKLLWAHHYAGWQGDLSSLKGNKKILVSGTTTCTHTYLLLLGYTKLIHIDEGHYSQTTEKITKARTKIENFTENSSLDKQGTRFYIQKG